MCFAAGDYTLGMLHVSRIAGAVTASMAIAMASASHRVDARPQTKQTIRRHFTPADRERGRYQYVPFDVPLGVIEPGPLTLGAATFRGYSGGATRSVTIGRDRSTPGYLAGPIPPGQWHVLLGLYKVAPDGVDVDIDITLRDDAGPRPAAPRWYSGGLHLQQHLIAA